MFLFFLKCSTHNDHSVRLPDDDVRTMVDRMMMQFLGYNHPKKMKVAGADLIRITEF